MRKLIIFILLFALYSCSENIDKINLSNSDFVVEGWLDKDSVAEVIVSHVIINTEKSESPIDSVLIKDAEVTLSDGTQAEQLTCINSSTYPYHLYKGKTIKGTCGKQYVISVKWKDSKASAQCSMYDDITIDSVTCKHVGETNQAISVHFTDKDYSNKYYLLLTKYIGHDERYYPAIMGCINGQQSTSPIIEIGLMKSIRNITQKTYDFKFGEGDSVSVRLTPIDEKTYHFWDSFFTATINKNDPLFPTITNIQSAITGAVGVWGCYSGNPFNFKVTNGTKK
jgi:hypothetical protein